MLHAPLLAAALLAQEPASLLPELPNGWRTERLAFPLSFAPDLEHAGFEDLAFAPGMFEPASDSYFSYVLALRLEGDLEVDRGFVQGFLEKYYRGLCAAVGEGKGFDLSGFAVAVEDRGAGFAARVDMVDAFVTGEPLALELELAVQPGPRATEIFGLASPKPRDAPVWRALDEMHERWRAARPVALTLNHLYAVPDEATYAALAGSEFLRSELAASEERETVRKDISYSGVYFYGEHTYFEFLSPKEAGSLVAGNTGIAFGIEVPGGTERLAAALREKGVDTFAGPVTRELDGEALAWFRILGVQQAHAAATLQLFAMEYAPTFLDEWHADLPPAARGIARRYVLERYAAKIGKPREEPLLRNVRVVRLALREDEREQLFEVCRAGGWIVERDGDAWVCDGPGVDLVVRSSAEPGGVTGFEMELRRPVEREPLQLGKATLSFAGTTATLSFAR